MEQEIQLLLVKLQEFTNTAFQKLQQGDTKSASFYFNLSSSLSGQISDKLNKI